MFSDSEMARLWNKMKRQRDKVPPMVDAWEKTTKLGRGKVQVAKRQMLWLWLEADGFPSWVISECQTISQVETVGTKSIWVSWGRLCVLNGEEEAPREPTPSPNLFA